MDGCSNFCIQMLAAKCRRLCFEHSRCHLKIHDSCLFLVKPSPLKVLVHKFAKGGDSGGMKV